MRTTSRVAFLLASTALVATAVAPADAGAQEVLNVSATVADACTVSAGGTLDFGEYLPGGGSKSSTATFTVNCVTPSDVNIGLGAGNNYDGTYLRMGDGPNNYLNRAYPVNADTHYL